MILQDTSWAIQDDIATCMARYYAISDMIVIMQGIPCQVGGNCSEPVWFTTMAKSGADTTDWGKIIDQSTYGHVWNFCIYPRMPGILHCCHWSYVATLCGLKRANDCRLMGYDTGNRAINPQCICHVNMVGASLKYKEWNTNSLCPSDAIWRQRSGSSLARVMARCPTAASHYINQCCITVTS